MDAKKSQFDAIFQALLQKAPLTDKKPAKKPPGDESTSELLKTIFSSLEQNKNAEMAKEAEKGKTTSYLEVLFGLRRKKKLSELEYWDIYPQQVKKWLVFTKSAKGYYDVNGKWVSVVDFTEVMGDDKASQSAADVERWEDLFHKEQAALPEDLRYRFRFGVAWDEVKDFHPKIRRLFSMAKGTEHEKLQLRKALAIEKWKAHDTDTASDPIQIDILTQRINSLQLHLEKNKKDEANKRNLGKLMRRRKGLMMHLKKRDVATYYTLLKETGLRDLYQLYPLKRLNTLPTKYRK